jgi:hypothetical protein
MFGFALSPDGKRLAYGGPFDGLFVGPAAGPFTKVSDLGVRCLKWGERGLYACGSQPPDPFTLGLSPNADGVFEPLYDARTTCPMTCEAGSFQAACAMPWSAIGPAIGAPSTCDVPWSDAGSPDACAAGGASGTGGFSGHPDASSPPDGGGGIPAAAPRTEARGGCACELAMPRKLGLEAALALLSMSFIAFRRRAAQRVAQSTDVDSSKQR